MIWNQEFEPGCWLSNFGTLCYNLYYTRATSSILYYMYLKKSIVTKLMLTNSEAYLFQSSDFPKMFFWARKPVILFVTVTAVTTHNDYILQITNINVTFWKEIETLLTKNPRKLSNQFWININLNLDRKPLHYGNKKIRWKRAENINDYFLLSIF